MFCRPTPATPAPPIALDYPFPRPTDTHTAQCPPVNGYTAFNHTALFTPDVKGLASDGSTPCDVTYPDCPGFTVANDGSAHYVSSGDVNRYVFWQNSCAYIKDGKLGQSGYSERKQA